jgi:hypothetical protein
MCHDAHNQMMASPRQVSRPREASISYSFVASDAIRLRCGPSEIEAPVLQSALKHHSDLPIVDTCRMPVGVHFSSRGFRDVARKDGGSGGIGMGRGARIGEIITSSSHTAGPCQRQGDESCNIRFPAEKSCHPMVKIMVSEDLIR